MFCYTSTKSKAFENFFFYCALSCTEECSIFADSFIVCNFKSKFNQKQKPLLYPLTFSCLLVQTKRKLYHPNNAQLGMAIMRAGVVHWHAGQIEEAHRLICKAYRILLATHGPNHAITKDLEVGWPKVLAAPSKLGLPIWKGPFQI